MSDFLRQTKEISPGATKATFQSENVGYYHTSMLFCFMLFSRLKIKVKGTLWKISLVAGKLKNK